VVAAAGVLGPAEASGRGGLVPQPASNAAATNTKLHSEKKFCIRFATPKVHTQELGPPEQQCTVRAAETKTVGERVVQALFHRPMRRKIQPELRAGRIERVEIDRG